MDNKKRKKYDRIAKITGILAGLILVLGTSYAVFRTVTRGEQDSVISAGKLDVRIENEQDEITLENAFPITEEEGKKQTPYTFDVVNKGTINAEYDLYIEIDESVSTLPVDVVRYYLTVEEDGTEKIVTSSARTISQEEVIEKEGKKLYKIDNKYLDTTKSNHYKLYLWVDYNATTEQATNKTFEAKVSIEAVQIYDENRLVQQIDVSEAGDGSVTAYMYANGNVVIKGQGQIKNNLSDTLIYISEEFIDIYKNVFIAAGAPEKDVTSFTSLQEFQDYLMRLQQEDPELYQSIISQDMETLLQLVIMQDVLESLGYDISDIELTMDAYMAYLVGQGLMDENGQPTDEGQEFYTKLEEQINSLNNPTIPAKSIMLEDGITNIPEGLFTGNEDITEVKIPASVTTIADRAFYGCRGLKELALPNSITSIGDSAFYNCSNLVSINIPSKVTTISSLSFYSTGLISIEIPSTVVHIEDYAFGYSKLKELNIPEGTTTIDQSAFVGCTHLEKVVLPTSLTTLGKNVFLSDSNIKELTFDATKSYGFSYTTGMEHLEKLTLIGSGTMQQSNFSWDSMISSIKEIVIENTITSICDNAFRNFQMLSSITIPNSITSIGTSAFYNCSNLKTIKIPESITNIGSYAFDHCTSLVSITIPKNVSNIGNFAFYVCNSLEEINVDKDNLNYKSIDGVLYDKNGQVLIRCPEQKDTIHIPDTVLIISTYAFSGCANLTEIIIPNGVTEIEANAFYGCQMMSITIPDSVTAIGDYAFNSCTNLSSIEIPTSVVNMGEYILINCDNLKKLTVDGTKGYDDFSAFKIEELIITGDGKMIQGDNSDGDRPYAWTASKDSIKKVIIKDGVTDIGNNAFSNMKNLTSVEIPTSVTAIGYTVFSGCTNLKTIEIPESVVTIGSYAFQSCTNIMSITISNNVTSIGLNTFAGWTSSQTIDIDNTETYVNENWDSKWANNCSATINYLRT